VRGQFNAVTVVDSRRALLLREPGRPPAYYFPRDDVRLDLLTQSPWQAAFPNLGEIVFWNLSFDGRTVENAAISHPAPPADRSSLADHLSFRWQAMDAWFEEEEHVLIHPRDPYARIVVLPSSRRVRIELDGLSLGGSIRPMLLFETCLPTRYYLPSEDVRLDLLIPTDSHTCCPHEGTASYYAVKLGGQLYADYVWTHLNPLPECARIRGLLAFYNEKVDLFVDGELEPKPQTKWSD